MALCNIHRDERWSKGGGVKGNKLQKRGMERRECERQSERGRKRRKRGCW